MQLELLSSRLSPMSRCRSNTKTTLRRCLHCSSIYVVATMSPSRPPLCRGWFFDVFSFAVPSITERSVTAVLWEAWQCRFIIASLYWQYPLRPRVCEITTPSLYTTVVTRLFTQLSKPGTQNMTWRAWRGAWRGANSTPHTAYIRTLCWIRPHCRDAKSTFWLTSRWVARRYNFDVHCPDKHYCAACEK